MSKYLLVLDFDETIAHTFEPSPNEMNVAKSYSLAVEEVLSTEGTKIYDGQGGLNNRAPQEVVHDILVGSTPTQREIILGTARQFLQERRHQLNGLVREGMGAPLEWKDGKDPVSIVAELLVRSKLGHTLREVCDVWPRPTLGFETFYPSLSDLRAEGVDVDVAVVSSGHDLFIEKVFEMWDLEKPRILVTDDTIRGLTYPKEVDRRVKPSAFPLALAHYKWMKEHELVDRRMNARRVAEDTRPYIAFIGDDPNKDGGMAARARILFGQFEESSLYESGRSDGTFKFGDWNDLGKLMNARRGLMKEGRSFDEILLSPYGRSPERL